MKTKRIPDQENQLKGITYISSNKKFDFYSEL